MVRGRTDLCDNHGCDVCGSDASRAGGTLVVHSNARQVCCCFCEKSHVGVYQRASLQWHGVVEGCLRGEVLSGDKQAKKVGFTGVSR